jgi:hypothetical protein
MEGADGGAGAPVVEDGEPASGGGGAEGAAVLEVVRKGRPAGDAGSGGGAGEAAGGGAGGADGAVDGAAGEGGAADGAGGEDAGERPLVSVELEMPEGMEGLEPVDALEQLRRRYTTVDWISRLSVAGLEKLGTKCRACNHPEHDVLFVSWCRGAMSADEAAERVGLASGKSWTWHCREHIPNYEALREQAKMVSAKEMHTLLRDLKAMSRRVNKEKFGRRRVLEENLMMATLQVLALTNQGFSSDPMKAREVAHLIEVRSAQAKELAHLGAEEAKLHNELKLQKEGTGWAELEAFQAEVMETLRAHPDVYKELMDKHRKRFPKPDEGLGA